MATPKGEVPNEDHVMRYVPLMRLAHDEEADMYTLTWTAFELRETDKGGLSTTWVEHYGLKSTATYGKAASAYRASLSSKKLGAKAIFAVGNAGSMRRACTAYGKNIRMVSAPDGPNTGHVEIRRFTDDDQRLLDMLASDVFTEHVRVSSLTLT